MHVLDGDPRADDTDYSADHCVTEPVTHCVHTTKLAKRKDDEHNRWVLENDPVIYALI